MKPAFARFALAYARRIGPSACSNAASVWNLDSCQTPGSHLGLGYASSTVDASASLGSLASPPPIPLWSRPSRYEIIASRLGIRDSKILADLEGLEF
jgi:hypothetical protein